MRVRAMKVQAVDGTENLRILVRASGHPDFVQDAILWRYSNTDYAV